MEIVNGYPCKTCTDVENAKKNIDPAHPKDGPNDENSPKAKAKAARAHGPAVLLGGVLAEAGQAAAFTAIAVTPVGAARRPAALAGSRPGYGDRLDIAV